MNRTPKRAKIQSENSPTVNSTPPNRLLLTRTPNSLEKTPVNGSNNENAIPASPSESRRGRPRAELLNTLILEGSSSPSSIKCTYCGRVFPREKSLQAHLRTHTGERPYACDYPRCTRRFTQSGQLKTHQRLHTGEKPFICTAALCERRFTHANRHCPEHPEAQLKRFTTNSPASDKSTDDDHSTAVQKWLKNNKSSSPNTNISTPRKATKLLHSFNGEEGENIFINTLNQKLSNTDSENSRSSSKTSLQELSSLGGDENMSDLENISIGSIAAHSNFVQFPLKSETNTLTITHKPTEYIELPKKRWLREAVQDQKRWDSSQELARPINWDENIVEYENQRRPTVLMRVQDRGTTKEISRADMQTAIALVELKNGGPLKYRQY